MAEQTIMVDLASGPADSAGYREPMPAADDPAERGARLISTDSPPRRADAHTDPKRRATYGGDQG